LALVVRGARILNTAKSKSTFKYGSKILFGGLALVFVFCAFLIFYLPNCRVTGVEFNPKSWQVREFEFWADPFTNLQLTGIQHDSTSIAIDSSILGCLSKSSEPDSDRWDLVELSDFRSTPSIGPASVLVDSLTTHKYGWSARPITFWTTWTSSNPTKAKSLWQAVYTLGIHHAYEAVPDILELGILSGDDFDESLNQEMGEALLQQAKIFEKQGKAKESSATAKAGLSFDSNNAELKQLAK
jgi:hypothetical protein